MLWTICMILVALWVLGTATAHTMGGLIHILLLLVIGSVAIRLIKGRRLV